MVVGDTSVTVHVVDRGDDAPIFTSRPVPLWTTCPVWIRPSTVIYTVRSIDEVVYDSQVYYRLESGKQSSVVLICIIVLWLSTAQVHVLLNK